MGLEERLRVIIETVSAGAVRDVKSLGDETEKTGSRWQRVFGRDGTASRSLSTFGIQGVDTFQGLDRAARVAGAGITAGIVTAGVKAVSTYVDLAAEVRNFQRVSGASAQDASRFVAVADDMGLSTESLSKGVFKLSREVASGGSELAAYGAQVARNKDGSTSLTNTLLNVADAFSKEHDQAKRNEIAFAAFGRSGEALIPILEKGRKGLRAFFDDAESGGQIFSQDEIDKARELELAMDGLQDAARGFALEFARGVVPAVTAGTKVLTGFLDVSQSIGAGGLVGGALGGAGIGAVLGGTRGGLVGAGIGGLLGVAGQGTGSAIGTGVGAVAGAALGAPLGMPFVGAAVGGVAGGLLGGLFNEGPSAAQLVSDAQKDSAKELVDLYFLGKKGTDEYRQAQEQLRSSSELLARAEDEVADSMGDVADKAVTAKLALLGLTQQGLNVTATALQYQQALVNVNDAQDKVNRAIEEHGAGSKEAAAAQLELQRAQLGLAQSAVLQDAAVQTLVKSLRDQGKSIQDVIERLNEEKRLHPEAAAAIDIQIGKLLELIRTGKEWNELPGYKQITVDVLVNSLYTGAGGAALAAADAAFYEQIAGRASGGPVSAGRLYRVNENRTEFFRPDVNGSVVPLAPGGAGAAAPSLSVAVYGSVIMEHELDDVVVNALNRWQRHNAR